MFLGVMTTPANDIPRPQPPAGRPFGSLIVIGLPCVLQLAFMYALLNIDSPFGPAVDRGRGTVLGAAMVAVWALALTTATMIAFYAILEIKRRRAAKDNSGQPWPF